MKRIALTTMAALIALAVAVSPASAVVQSVQKFTAKATPNKAGTKKKPRAVAFRANPYFDSIAADLDREVQFATVNARVYYPKEGITNAKFFPTCELTVVFQDEKRCPRGSLIGTAKGFGKGLGLDEEVVGKFYNTAGGKGVNLLVTGESPLIIREVVAATLEKLSGDPLYGYKLTFGVPRNLQSPAPGVLAAVMRFDSTVPISYVKRKGKKIPFLATTGCATGKWAFKYEADYTTSYDSTIASSQTVEVTQPCRK